MVRNAALKYEMLRADGKHDHVAKAALLSLSEKAQTADEKAVLSALDVHGSQVSWVTCKGSFVSSSMYHFRPNFKFRVKV